MGVEGMSNVVGRIVVGVEGEKLHWGKERKGRGEGEKKWQRCEP